MAELTKQEIIHKFWPIYFYRNHLDIGAKDVLGLTLVPHHRIVMRDYGNQRKYYIWLSSRGMGKTVLSAIYILLMALLYPRNKIMVVAGTAFRGAKFLMLEIEKIILGRLSSQKQVNYARAALQDPRKCINKDQSYWSITFKNGSSIYGVPLGKDGDTIRGIRAFIIVQDESFLLPRDLNQAVLEPMLNVLMDPTKSMEEQPVTSQSIKISTIDYSHRDFWKEAERYKEILKSKKDVVLYNSKIKPKDVSFFEFNFEDSFIQNEDGSRKILWGMDLDRIYNKKEDPNMDKEIWMAENKNKPMDVEGGYFSFEAVEACSNFLLDDKRDLYPEALYSCCGKCILGVDTAPSEANCAFTIVKAGSIDSESPDVNFCKTANSGRPCPMLKNGACLIRHKNAVLYAYEENKMSQEDRVKMIYHLMDRYNIINVGIDARGGGYEVADLLRDTSYVKEKAGFDKEPLYDPEKIDLPYGKPLLTLYSTNQMDNMIFNGYLKALLTNTHLLLPRALRERPDNPNLFETYGHIETLKSQLARIKALPSGQFLKFIIETTDPETGRKVPANKDVYSSLLYAVAKLREYVTNIEEEVDESQDDIPLAVSFTI